MFWGEWNSFNSDLSCERRTEVNNAKKIRTLFIHFCLTEAGLIISVEGINSMELAKE